MSKMESAATEYARAERSSCFDLPSYDCSFTEITSSTFSSFPAASIIYSLIQFFYPPQLPSNPLPDSSSHQFPLWRREVVEEAPLAAEAELYRTQQQEETPLRHPLPPMLPRTLPLLPHQLPPCQSLLPPLLPHHPLHLPPLRLRRLPPAPTERLRSE